MSRHEGMRTTDIAASVDGLRRLVRGLLGRTDGVDDVVQETLLAAAERPAAATDQTTWLRGVARNLALRWRRDRARREERERMASRLDSVEAAATTVERVDRLRALLDAVEELPEPYRRAVVMRFFDGMAPRDIARRTGAPVATVKTWLQRGLEKLRVWLDERQGTRGGWMLLLAHDVGLSGFSAASGATVTGLGVGIMKMKAVGVFALLLLGLVPLTWWLTLPADDDDSRDSASRVTQVSEAPDAAAESTNDVAPTKTLPYREDDSEGAVDSSGLLVTVCSEDERPVADARVVLLGDERVWADERTDARGRARLPERLESRRVLVAAREHLPVVVAVDAANPELEVTLPEGHRLSGVVTVDGRVPTWSLRLDVLSERAFPGIAGVPDALWKELKDWLEPKKARLHTDAAGRFTLRGLPDRWRGSVVVPWTHVLDPGTPGARSGGLDEGDDRRVVDLEGPVDDLHLDLVGLRLLTGRVVHPDTGEGLPKVIIHGSFRAVSHFSWSIETEADGRFRVPMQRGGHQGRHVAGGGPARFRFGLPPVGRAVRQEPGCR
ncbi:MAG: hypothetical protein CMJ83_09465 [Planctomycetes bacterium]|nr:hypothetical protein [Planctomycetota bacterium]